MLHRAYLRKHNLIMHFPGIGLFSFSRPTIFMFRTLDIHHMHVYTKIEANYAKMLTRNTCRNCSWFLCCYNIIMRHIYTWFFCDKIGFTSMLVRHNSVSALNVQRSTRRIYVRSSNLVRVILKSVSSKACLVYFFLTVVLRLLLLIRTFA